MSRHIGGTTMDRVREWATTIATLAIFFALFGIVGRMEMDAMIRSDLESRMETIREERSGFRTWENSSCQ